MAYSINSSGLPKQTETQTVTNHDPDGSVLWTQNQNVTALRDTTKLETVYLSGKTEGFRSRLEKGELIQYTDRHVKREWASVGLATPKGRSTDPITGNFVTDTGPSCGPYYFSATFPSTNSTPETDTSQGYDPLLTEALGEAKAGALMILLELAEAPKVVQLFAQFGRNLRRRRDFIRRQVRRKYNWRSTKYYLRDYHKTFSDMWLEYRYGWRQLYYTGEDILRALEILSQGKKFTVVTGRGYASGSLTGNMSSWQYANNYFGGMSRTDDDISVTVEKRAAVSMQVSTIGAAFDFNLLSLGWELIPYSFVIDWFVNIGDVARAVWPVPHLGMTACTSWKKSSKIDVSYTRAPVGGITSNTGRLLYTREEYKRTPYNQEIPIVFDYDPFLGLDRITDLIALAKQVYSKNGPTPYRT